MTVTTLSCRQVLEELSNYLDGDVAEELRRAIDGHLSRCHRCTIVFDTTRQTLRIVRDAEPFDVPLEVSARLYARLSTVLSGRAQ